MQNKEVELMRKIREDTAAGVDLCRKIRDNENEESFVRLIAVIMLYEYGKTACPNA